MPTPGDVDFSKPAAVVARDLIGVQLLVSGRGGTIVETEAYDPGDPASHSHRGPTKRNASMFGPPAHAYVYLSYGLHWCLNFVCQAEGEGAAVLIRALEAAEGIEWPGPDGAQGHRACAGPGRLTRLLGVTSALDGASLRAIPFELRARRTQRPIVAGPRVGISKGTDLPWRFGAADSRCLSRAFDVAATPARSASPP